MRPQLNEQSQQHDSQARHDERLREDEGDAQHSVRPHGVDVA